MLLLILVALVSLVPMLLVFWWMRNKSNLEPSEKKLCDKAFRYGLLTILPVTLLSGTSHILLGLTGIYDTFPLLYRALYTFIVLALAEEVAKFFMFKHLLKKEAYTCTWLTAVILMVSVHTGFSIMESITYAFGSNIPTMLIRGISFPHVGYGFLVGYYYGKGIKMEKPSLVWIGFFLAWFIHGLYDFSLSEELLAINEYIVFLPFILVAIDIALVVALIRFICKERKNHNNLNALPNNA